MNEDTPQQRLKAKLEALPLAKLEVKVYGSQVTVTCLSRGAAEKWWPVLARFARMKGLLERSVPAQENQNTVLLPTQRKVFTVYAEVR